MKYKLLLPLVLVLPATLAFTQDGKDLYNKNCKACHTVGGGNKVGPDLKGIVQKRELDWLVRFIKSSKDMITSGDADAVAVYEQFGKKPMPSHNMSNAEVQSILNFIAAGGDAGSTAENTNESPPDVFTPDANTGRDLFTGKIRLQNGGATCVSCHSIRDSKVDIQGTFAKDLSVSHIDGVVETMLTTMPAMISSYGTHTLTFQEKSHLELYLKTVKGNQIFYHSGVSLNMFLLYGFIVFITILAVIHLFWRHTKNYGVKDEIYNRQITTK